VEVVENGKAREELVLDFGRDGIDCGGASLARAQSAHSHSGPGQELLQGQKSKAGALVRTVLEATERFKDVNTAEAEGYHPQFGCVTGPDAGAMGMHFVNGPLVDDGLIDATKPEIVIYEPQPNGSLTLIGADYLVLADQWNATHVSPPELMGQLFSFVRSSQPFRTPGVLHPARVGMEGQSHGHVRELEYQRVVRRLQRTVNQVRNFRMRSL
jgi:hypothetical protein